MEEAFQTLRESMDGLLNSFYPQAAFGNLDGVGLTQYSFWMFIAILIMVAVLLLFKHRQKSSLVPHGFFVNAGEFVIDYVKNDILKGTVGDSWKQHFPFIASVFLFILFNNLVGILPTLKPGTGTISVTLAVALCSFFYFIAAGIKKHGVLGYIKSLAPQGIPAPIRALLWLIELFSTFLRLVTLAVRLFCNMFAGHVVMATFATMCMIFLQPLANHISAAAFGMGSLSVLWLALLIGIYLIEIMIAAVQAYVFALLSAVYIQLAEEND